MLPSTRRALRKLNGENSAGVKLPIIFLTNGGGVLESRKAQELSAKFGVPVREDQVVLAHTPMRTLPEINTKLRDGLVLVIGRDEVKQVALNYGLKRPVLPGEIQAKYPAIWPFTTSKMPACPYNLDDEPFTAVVVMHDSRDWSLDSQICCDILRSDGGLLGTLAAYHHSPAFKQSVPIYFSNPDFLWSNNFPVVRFGQGAFRMCLETMYRNLTGHDLKIEQHFGKPFPATYKFGLDAINKQALLDKTSNEEDFQNRTVYGIGDNLASDILGANMNGCHSILVRTGVFKEDPEDKSSPFKLSDAVIKSLQVQRDWTKDTIQQSLSPKTICDDVGDAVDFIFQNEQIL